MIAKRLKELRIRNGFSQQQLADVLGLCRSAYSNYEIGRRKPEFAIIKKLAAFYRVSLDVFDDTITIDLYDDSDFQGDAPQYVSELSKGERELIVRYRLLDSTEKRKLLAQLKNKEE